MPPSGSPAVRRPGGSGNRLLAALPPADFDLLVPQLKTVALDQDAVLSRVGNQIEHVFFPHSGAISLMVVGVIHAQQYYYDYFSVVPTIGTLFLLSFVGSGLVGATLILPVRRLGRNIGDLILALAALGGIGIALGSLVALLISEYTPLFGFMESGYRLAVVLTLIFDTLTSCLLALFVVALARSRRGAA